MRVIVNGKMRHRINVVSIIGMVLLLLTLTDIVQSEQQVMPEIIFDKEEYTPFDEVLANVIWVTANRDPNRVETIDVVISSQWENNSETFIETGANTGIFEGKFKLTPNRAMFGGDLLAGRDTTVAIEFQSVKKAVFVSYHVGQVMFDKDQYKTNQKVVVRVIDPDANRYADIMDSLNVRVWSSADKSGLLLALKETGDRTGIFEGVISLTNGMYSDGTSLRVAGGDTLTAKYIDDTLPAPATLATDRTTTVETEELFGSAFIGSVLPPLGRVSISPPELLDQTGELVTDVRKGSSLQIQSIISNPQIKHQPFSYIVQIKDAKGVTIQLSWAIGELPPSESLSTALSWIPDKSGAYSVEIFVWASVDYADPLSTIRKSTVLVR